MIDNAVAHFEHLVEQGKNSNEAIEHAVQRYGVPRHVLVQRVVGRVADHQATMNALAEARERLVVGEDYDDNRRALLVLRKLYNAITGENL